MGKQTINSVIIHEEEHGHLYTCKVIDSQNSGLVLSCPKLPPLLKAIREDTGYTFKVPHGNKVRTLILEEGICVIHNGEDTYEITIERW